MIQMNFILVRLKLRVKLRIGLMIQITFLSEQSLKVEGNLFVNVSGTIEIANREI